MPVRGADPVVGSWFPSNSRSGRQKRGDSASAGKPRSSGEKLTRKRTVGPFVPKRGCRRQRKRCSSAQVSTSKGAWGERGVFHEGAVAGEGAREAAGVEVEADVVVVEEAGGGLEVGGAPEAGILEPELPSP